MDSVLDQVEARLATQRVGEAFPQLIHTGNTRDLLKGVSGKRVSSSSVDVLNIIFATLVEDIAACSVMREAKQINPRDVMEIIRLRQSMNLNIGSLQITRVTERADIKVVQQMVHRELRKVKEAMKAAKISDSDIELAMNQYDLMTQVEADADEDDDTNTDEV